MRNMAHASTGYLRIPRRGNRRRSWAISRQSRDEARTLALSTDVSFLRRVRARSKNQLNHAPDLVFPCSATCRLPPPAVGPLPALWLASIAPPVSSRTIRMSTPRTRSGRRGLASTRGIGALAPAASRRRRPSLFWREANSPAPAERPPGSLQRGPPTAPNRTASADRQRPNVSFGEGGPKSVNGATADQPFMEGKKRYARVAWYASKRAGPQQSLIRCRRPVKE